MNYHMVIRDGGRGYSVCNDYTKEELIKALLGMSEQMDDEEISEMDQYDDTTARGSFTNAVKAGDFGMAETIFNEYNDYSDEIEII